MNINRHNYEEFIILYMDNELSIADRSMVESFLENHPDLKEELDMLMQYKLVPDESIVFDNKESLIKGDAIINVANYEEWFLFYIDNELSTMQKQAVDQFIVDNPVFKKELEILQQTKHQPESIVFTHKASLYRTEDKVRFMSTRWQRVAAILILALGLTTIFLLNNKKSAIEIPIAKTPGTEQNIQPVITNEQALNESIAADINEKQKPVNIIPEEKDNVYQAALPVNKTDDKKIANNKAVQSPVIKLAVNNNPVNNKKEEPVLIANNNKNNNNLPQPTNNPNVIKEDAVSNPIASVNTPKENKKVDLLTNPAVTTKSTQPSDYTNASFIEEESQQDGKKNKLRGFFRKLTRTFEKRTNIDATDDDDRLLVAGLAIKLK